MFADYLEEFGEPDRAKLIRTQIARTAGQRVGWDMPRVRPRAWFDPWWPGRSCWSFHNPQWDLLVARVRPTSEPGWGDVLYVRRGFVDEVRGTLAGMRQRLPALLAAHPVTRVGVDMVGHLCRTAVVAGSFHDTHDPADPTAVALPRDVFDRLDPPDEGGGYGGEQTYWRYEHGRDLQAALSAALLAEARGRVTGEGTPAAHRRR